VKELPSSILPTGPDELKTELLITFDIAQVIAAVKIASNRLLRNRLVDGLEGGRSRLGA
jgi:hypothetical protein